MSCLIASKRSSGLAQDTPTLHCQLSRVNRHVDTLPPHPHRPAAAEIGERVKKMLFSLSNIGLYCLLRFALVATTAAAARAVVTPQNITNRNISYWYNSPYLYSVYYCRNYQAKLFLYVRLLFKASTSMQTKWFISISYQSVAYCIYQFSFKIKWLLI